MDKRLKTGLILAGIAVAAYLAYRWYQNRQSNSQGLGANLNSATPELVAGSSGPSSGLNYYAGSTTVDITEPVTSSGKQTVHGIIPGVGFLGEGPVPHSAATAAPDMTAPDQAAPAG